MKGTVFHKNAICWFQKGIVFFILLVGCGKSSDVDGSDVDDKEQYNQLPFASETDQEGPPAPKQFVQSMPQDMLEKIHVEMEYVNQDRKEVCRLDWGSMALREKLDRSVVATASVHGVAVLDGVVQESEGRRRNCTVLLIVPLNVEAPPSLPWTWNYKEEHLTNPNNIAERYSRTTTGPKINIITNKGDGSIYDEEPIYPKPPTKDPYAVEMEGYTRILSGSRFSWEKVLFYAESYMRVKDHAGLELKVWYTTSAK